MLVRKKVGRIALGVVGGGAGPLGEKGVPLRGGNHVGESLGGTSQHTECQKAGEDKNANHSFMKIASTPELFCQALIIEHNGLPTRALHVDRVFGFGIEGLGDLRMVVGQSLESDANSAAISEVVGDE